MIKQLTGIQGLHSDQELDSGQDGEWQVGARVYSGIWERIPIESRGILYIPFLRGGQASVNK